MVNFGPCFRMHKMSQSKRIKHIYQVDNGTPQGSVCSPILFNIMINDIFGEIELGIGKALYTDDGALWKRGKNLQYVGKKMQEAVDVVENWANQWGFRLSVAKTQVMFFKKEENS